MYYSIINFLNPNYSILFVMTEEKLLSFLEENNFVDIVKEKSVHFVNVFKDCLGVKKEKVLLMGDIGTKEKPVSGLLLGCYYFAAKDLDLDFVIALQHSHEENAPASEEIRTALDDLPKGSVIVMSLSNKLGSIRPLSGSFRKLVRKREHRFVSSSSMGYLAFEDFDALIRSINIDYDSMREKAKRLKNILDSAKKIRITTELGTDLTFDVNPDSAVCSDAYYVKPGEGGNIPGGEVFLPPVEDSANGKVVVDGSIRDLKKTTVVDKPVTFKIENGRVTSVEGEKSSLLETAFESAEKLAKYPERIRKFCEFGVGINPGAAIIGSTIVDEKTLNTAHIAFGSNYWFGGTIRSIVHLDQVFKNPVIEVDGKIIEY